MTSAAFSGQTNWPWQKFLWRSSTLKNMTRHTTVPSPGDPSWLNSSRLAAAAHRRRVEHAMYQVRLFNFHLAFHLKKVVASFVDPCYKNFKPHHSVVYSQERVVVLKSDPVLPHLAIFCNPCKVEGLIATQKRSFATCKFLVNFEFQKIVLRKLPKWFKVGPKKEEYFSPITSLCS